MSIHSICLNCGNDIEAHVPRKYCSVGCVAEGTRKYTLVTDEWLKQKYIDEGLGIYDIGRLINRAPKSVWRMLKAAGIPTRPRGQNIVKARKNNPEAFNPKGRKSTLETKEKIRQAALKDGRVPYLNKDGVHWLKGKTGAISPVWRGGITPERQAFYGTPEWKQTANLVWRRDYGKCRKCGLVKYNENKTPLDIHHIISFACREARGQLCNLVLLCEPCHYWVHSRENTQKEFIIEYNN
jgi:hypothetical protein